MRLWSTCLVHLTIKQLSNLNDIYRWTSQGTNVSLRQYKWDINKIFGFLLLPPSVEECFINLLPPTKFLFVKICEKVWRKEYCNNDITAVLTHICIRNIILSTDWTKWVTLYSIVVNKFSKKSNSQGNSWLCNQTFWKVIISDMFYFYPNLRLFYFLL